MGKKFIVAANNQERAEVRKLYRTVVDMDAKLPKLSCLMQAA